MQSSATSQKSYTLPTGPTTQSMGSGEMPRLATPSSNEHSKL